MLMFDGQKSPVRVLTNFAAASPRQIGGESAGIFVGGEFCLFTREEDSVCVRVWGADARHPDIHATHWREVIVRPTIDSLTEHGLDTPGPVVDEQRNRIAVLSTAGTGQQACVRSWAILDEAGCIPQNATWHHDPHEALATLATSPHMTNIVGKNSGPTEFSCVKTLNPDGGYWVFFDVHGASPDHGEWKLGRARLKNPAGSRAQRLVMDPDEPVFLPRHVFHPFVTRGPDTALYMAYLDGPAHRLTPHVAGSEDEGRTWKHIGRLASWADLDIDESVNVAYRVNSPWLAFDPDGRRVLVGCVRARKGRVYRSGPLGNEAVVWEVRL